MLEKFITLDLSCSYRAAGWQADAASQHDRKENIMTGFQAGYVGSIPIARFFCFESISGERPFHESTTAYRYGAN
ncbi:MAG TPA: hypothetical protein PK054_08180 [Anaerohalosphaeraceae bacterium]|nr:hypothetical protein [Anaerohalosphaeraceae bacterium]HPP56546.1 hypothetical protein [Anaerohalosphaeraceae bacterium]